jgi:hypothetical protein
MFPAKPVDWNSIDWSRQDRDITEELQINPNRVSSTRRRLRKPRPKFWHKPKTFVAFLERWNKVDWRQANVALARQMGVSQERVRQIRKSLNKPEKTIKAPHPGVNRRLRQIDVNLDRLRGLTLRQATELLCFGLASGTAARRYLDALEVLRHGSRRHPWNEMNFDLGNTVLARIWKVRRDIITTYRHRHGIGPAKWNGNTFHPSSRRANDATYCRAVADERAKAQSIRPAGIPARHATRSPPPAFLESNRLQS